MGQFWRIILVALMIGMSLSACSTPQTPSPAPTIETKPSPTQGELANPSPASNTPTSPSPAQELSTYPPPVQALPAYPSSAQELPSNNPYPGPSQSVGNYLDWSKAEELIMGGKVAKVYHAQTMRITLVLKDGSVAETIEPALDEVFKVIERCGQVCSDIEQIKE